MPALAQDAPASGSSAAGSSGDATQSTAPSPVAGNDPQDGDILVTARRREEALQDVPIAITVLTGGTLEARGVRSAEDLRTISPSLNVGGQSRDNGNFYLRGQTPGVIQAGQRNFTSIATYFAEVPTNVGGPGLFFDLANVQVLKGPQGTLFGRNTTGGAILFEPHAPTSRPEGYIQGSGGNHDFFQVEGAVNVPLSEAVQVRLAGVVSRREGYTRSTVTNQRLDGRDYEGMRFSLRIAPGAGLESTTIVDYRHKDNSGSGNILRQVNPSAPLGSLATPAALAPLLGLPAGTSITLPIRAGGTVSVACLQAALPGCPTGAFGGAVAGFQAAYNRGNFADPANGGFYLIAPTAGLNAALANQQAIGPRRNSTALIERNASMDWGVTNRTTLDLSDTITLKNIIAFRRSRANSSLDYDGAAFQTIDSLYVRSQEWGTGQDQFTEEFQLQGELPDAHLNYLAGYYHEFSKPGFRQILPARQFGTVTTRFPGNRDQSDAIFAHVEFQPIPLIGISGGIRQTWDKRVAFSEIRAGQENINGSCVGSSLLCPTQYKAKFDALTYDGTVNVKPMDDVLIYGTYRRGYKSGGFTLPAPADFQVFRPETVDDFEIGLKADWNIGVPLRTNVALFHDKYKDVQISQPTLIGGAIASVVQNIGRQTNKGVEVEATIFPVQGLSIGGFYSYVSAESDVDVISPTGQPVVSAGQQIPFTPRTKWGVNGSWRIPVGSSDITASADYSWQSRQNTSDRAAPLNTYPGYGVLNARLEWRDSFAPGVDLSVFGTNILDKDYILGGLPLYSQLGYESVIYGEPAMYGASLRFRWGGR